MKLKRFVASDSAKAMRMIKDTFGPDAVILSSHGVEEGVEVVAAVDYDESVVNVKEVINTSSSRSSAPIQDSGEVTSPLNEMRQEIQTLRSMIETQLTLKNPSDVPLHRILLEQLSRLGFSQSMAQKLVQPIRPELNQSQAWQQVLVALDEQLLIFPGRRIEESGIYAFVGPTGVGKTTTLAKLAARFCLRFGPSNLGLITTDSYRIAAHEQLMTYGKILGVNVCLAEDETSLMHTLEKLSDKKLILIDTAGMNPCSPRVKEQMSQLKQYSAISTVLVMSATTQYAVLQQTFEAYSAYSLDQCIITKLDETLGAGAAISVSIENNLPLSYITNGQRVPEDIKFAVTDYLMEKLACDDLYLTQSNRVTHESKFSLKGVNYA